MKRKIIVKLRRFMIFVTTVILISVYWANFIMPVMAQISVENTENLLEKRMDLYEQMMQIGAIPEVLDKIADDVAKAMEWRDQSRSIAQRFWMLKLPSLLQLVLHIIAILFVITYVISFGGVLRNFFKDFRRFFKKKG